MAFALLGNIRPAQAQDHKLSKIWQTADVLKTPESVLYDGSRNILFFSNIGDTTGGKNGKGSLGKLGVDGKVIKLDWVTGMNGPKGLGRFHNLLYAADIDEVVVVDIESAKIQKRIPVRGAQFLNDITVDAKGVVYVSDTKTGKVHRIEKGLVSDYAEGIEGANGVLAVGDDVYVLGNGNMYKVDKGRKVERMVTGMDASTDGIEMVKEKEFLVSAWDGIIYYINKNGSKQTLLDIRKSKVNTADIGYDAKTRMVYVPTFFKNSVIAYRLQ